MITYLRNRILTAVFIFASLGTFSAKADLFSCGVDLGKAGRTKQWAVFTLGSGVNTNVNLSGQSLVVGDVGAAGKGDVNLSAQSTINGNLYYHTGGALNNAGGTITGSRFNNAASDALLDQAAMDAQNASDQAFNLAVTPAYASLTNVNLSGSQNITITGSQCVVLKLNNFILSSGTFTLAGTAGTSYIINVRNQFSLSNSAKIVLGTGINPQDVLFNVRGTGSATMSGNAQFNGILLATKRTVSISGSSSVKGEVIANSVNLSGQSTVTAVSPTSNP